MFQSMCSRSIRNGPNGQDQNGEIGGLEKLEIEARSGLAAKNRLFLG